MTTAAEPSRTALPVVATAPKLGAAIDYELFMDCVHCGLCLSSCPTYVETGNENDSPRGRIYLWRAVTDGRAELSDEVRRHLDLCLECRACESACPSGVQYGQIIGSYKKDMARLGYVAPTLGRLQRWMLFHLTPYRGRMRWALAPLRLMQRVGLGGAVRRLSRLLPPPLRRMQDMVPRLAPHYGRLPEVLPAEGKRRARVALFIGCAADAFFPRTTLATARVLQRNGCEVWVPRGQGCCGALHYHAGLVGPARDFAAANSAAFGKELAGVDAIINNAGGCGPVLREYSHLLPDTPAAAAFAAKSRDISEFLVELGPVQPEHPLPIRATYHDACGLSHAQKIRQPPRQLLSLIPGLELVPLAETEHCCGAAGSYNLTQPEMSQALGLRKAKNVLDTGAQAVFTGNVGCLLQIARYLREARPDLWVAHPVDALWASYSGELPPEISRGTR
ncbi:MAG TPA: (Fe-S)-binding protein [Gemmataceae bacterium]|nr:(Fe-S)-binding protein [Gemmataceae bacterium]